VGVDKWSVKTRVEDLPLKERFVIARESWDVARNVFVEVDYNGLSGIGACDPAERWEESVDSVVDAIDSFKFERLADPFDFETLSQLLPAGSARSAIDIALHDLAAQMAGVPLCKFLGLRSDPLPPTSVTVPISTADDMVGRAEKLRDHPVLKLKVGFDGDVETVRSIRDVYDGALRIDANEGWSADEAIDRLGEVSAYGIEFCEQPVHGDDEDGLRRVAESSPIPVFADESACVSSDVARLAGGVSGVNLKLRKAGGIRELMKGIAVARAHSLSVMIGCDLETGIGCTAAAHMGSLVDHLDVDGFLLLARDPYPGVTCARGRLGLPTAHGLGCGRD
jgi:L-alanine-DL-glutamate epimerase-like enolase superfamily enzyme